MSGADGIWCPQSNILSIISIGSSKFVNLRTSCTVCPDDPIIRLPSISNWFGFVTLCKLEYSEAYKNIYIKSRVYY